MNIKFLGCIISLLLPILVMSCKEDETSVDTNKDDPRVRSVVMYSNKDLAFVINDVENIIYNYDSLAYGTDLTSMRFHFFGYVSSPVIKYKYETDKSWTRYENGSYIDLSSPITILSTSEDGANQKTYKFDLRVHKFDVAAFSWRKIGSIELDDIVTSQKSFSVNGKWHWFCSTKDGSNYCFSSNDKGKTWKKKTLGTSAYNWNSLVLFNDKFYVQDSAKDLYESSSSDLSFSKKESLKMDYLLFEVDNKLWAIADSSLYVMEKNGDEFVKKTPIPSDFSYENLVSFTAETVATQLGYLYSTKDGKGLIWSMDYKGNFFQVVSSDNSLPYLENPMVYKYDRTLGIVGGKLADGSYSSVCYASYNNGVSWTEDWHKKLSGDLKNLNNAGVFVTSNNGELLLVGGNIGDDTFSSSVWRGVLNQLIEEELVYGD